MAKVRTLPSYAPRDEAACARECAEELARLSQFKTKIQLLDNRLVEQMVESCSISVCTFGNLHTWDTCMLVEIDEDDPHNNRTVLDEVCGTLDCMQDEAIWAMTCIHISLEQQELVLPARMRDEQRDVVRRLAIVMLQEYGRSGQDDDYFNENETEQEQEVVNETVRELLVLFKDRSQTPALYNGIIKYSFP